MGSDKRKVRIIIFQTSERESRLKEIVESLGVNGRRINVNGSLNAYIIDGLSKAVVDRGNIIVERGLYAPMDYSLLIEGALRGNDIMLEKIKAKIPAAIWYKEH